MAGMLGDDQRNGGVEGSEPAANVVKEGVARGCHIWGRISKARCHHFQVSWDF